MHFNLCAIINQMQFVVNQSENTLNFTKCTKYWLLITVSFVALDNYYFVIFVEFFTYVGFVNESTGP